MSSYKYLADGSTALLAGNIVGFGLPILIVILIVARVFGKRYVLKYGEGKLAVFFCLIVILAIILLKIFNF
ncbi:hypothetical protein [Paenibacillus sp. FSL H7-0331]|uniref:hypothetical protein n=1 Tax=Paenibacillus sp. FSL H7-0331 TaxID=1920421 RepID=UPI0015C3E196|nr:hypothetical protein [Paenibacillus sp. FSL H7-0331]